MTDLFSLLKNLQDKAEEINTNHPSLFQSNIMIPLRANSFSTIQKRAEKTRQTDSSHQTLSAAGKVFEMQEIWVKFCEAHQECSGGLPQNVWSNGLMVFQKRDNKITLIYKNRGALTNQATEITVKGHINIARALTKHAKLPLAEPCFLHHIHTERGLVPLEIEAPTPALALARLMCLRLKSYENSINLRVSQVAPYDATIQEAQTFVEL